jgi:hypothetical protein
MKPEPDGGRNVLLGARGKVFSLFWRFLFDRLEKLT